APVAEALDRAPMGEQSVVRGGEGGAPVAHPRRLDAEAVAEEGRDPGLVVGDPRVDDAVERVEDEPRVLGEAVADLARGPAALVLERLREVPVVEGRERLDPALAQALGQTPVEVEALLVRGPAAVRLDARPRDREAVPA